MTRLILLIFPLFLMGQEVLKPLDGKLTKSSLSKLDFPVNPSHILALALDDEGNNGWAVGYGGLALRKLNGEWRPGEWEIPTVADLNDIWWDESSRRGWIVGGLGTILSMEGDTGWRLFPSSTTGDLNAVWMNETGSEGWAVGNFGVVLKFENGAWREQGKPGGRTLYDIWMSADRPMGYAVGRGPVILMYQEGKWQTIYSQDRDTNAFFAKVAMNAGETQAWALGRDLLKNEGMIFEIRVDQWSRIKQENDQPFPPLYDLWLSEDGERGFAVGGLKGENLVLGFKSYERDSEFPWKAQKLKGDQIENPLRLIWISNLEETGLLIGEEAYYYRAEVGNPITYQRAPDFVLRQLKGAFTVYFDAPLSGEPDLELIDKWGKNKIHDHHYVFDHKTSRSFTFRFTPATTELLDDFTGDPGSLRVRAYYKESGEEVTYGEAPSLSGPIGESATYLIPESWWPLLMVLGIAIVHFLILLWAVNSPNVRNFLLRSVPILGRRVPLGVFILGVNWVFWAWKHALFTGYMRNVKSDHEVKKKWADKHYFTPNISGDSLEDGEPPSLRKLLNHILDHKTRRFWVIEGRSSIGKSALVEHLFLESFTATHIPIILKLGKVKSLMEQLRAELLTYGDFDLDDEATLRIFKSGRFIFFVHGISDDQSPETTMKAISVLGRGKKNIFVLSARQKTDWLEHLKGNFLKIWPFQETQWLQVFGSNILENDLRTAYLLGLAALPPVALQIRKQLSVVKELDYCFEIDLYEVLIKNLTEPEDKECLDTLANHAWDSFRSSIVGQRFVLSQSFLSRATQIGIMTKQREGVYEINGKRKKAYFAARHLLKQETPLSTLEETNPSSRDADYWCDVFELMAEHKARDAVQDRQKVIEYHDFLIRVAGISYHVFDTYLIPQYKRLIEDQVLKPDSVFDDWLRLLKSVDKGRHQSDYRSQELLLNRWVKEVKKQLYLNGSISLDQFPRQERRSIKARFQSEFDFLAWDYDSGPQVFTLQRSERFQNFKRHWNEAEKALGGGTINDFRHPCHKLTSLLNKSLPFTPSPGAGFEATEFWVEKCTVTNEDLNLTPATSFPLAFLFRTTLNKYDVDNAIGFTSRMKMHQKRQFGIIITFQNTEAAVQVVRKTQHDFVVLGREEVWEILFADNPGKRLRHFVIMQVDLTRISRYQTSGPVMGSMYYGRRDIEQKVVRDIHKYSFSIVANRRMGKTSLIRRLIPRLEKSHQNHVYFIDLQKTFNHEHFFRQAYKLPDFNSLTSGTYVPLYDIESFCDLIQRLLELKKGKTLIFIMDEVDQLLKYDVETESERLFLTFRELNQEGRVRFIFSGTTVLNSRVHHEDSPFFNFGQVIPLGPLDEKDAKDLITEPMADLQLKIDDAVVNKIVSLTANHANLIQQVCDGLIEAVNEKIKRDPENRNIGIVELDKIMSPRTFLEDFEEAIWGQAGKLERLIILETFHMETFGIEDIQKLENPLVRSIARTDLKLVLKKLVVYSILAQEKADYTLRYRPFFNYIGDEVIHQKIEELTVELGEIVDLQSRRTS